MTDFLIDSRLALSRLEEDARRARNVPEQEPSAFAGTDLAREAYVGGNLGLAGLSEGLSGRAGRIGAAEDAANARAYWGERRRILELAQAPPNVGPRVDATPRSWAYATRAEQDEAELEQFRAERERDLEAGASDWERYFHNNAQEIMALADAARPNPAGRGWAANIINSVTETLAAGAVGGPLAPITLGFGYGLQTENEMLAQGLTPQQARQAGQISGVGMGLMGLAPVAAGGRILTRNAAGQFTGISARGLASRAGSGAALNLGFGAGMRGSMHEYLSSIGREDLARDYQWFDGQAMAIDAILGAAFGVGFGRPGRARTADDHFQTAAQLAGNRNRRQEAIYHAMAARAGGHLEADALFERMGFSPETLAELAAPDAPLPQTPDAMFEEAQRAAAIEEFPQAYAYALLARDMGHSEARGLIEALEEDATPEQIDEGRALADEIAADNMDAPSPELVSAAVVHAGTMRDMLSAGVPVNAQSRAYVGETLKAIDEQIVNDEPIVALARPDGVDFVAGPDAADQSGRRLDEQNAAELDALDTFAAAFEQYATEHGLAADAENIAAMKEQLGLPRDDDALFSRTGAKRVAADDGGPVRNDRLVLPPGVKLTRLDRDGRHTMGFAAAEMATNGARNHWIAAELETSPGSVKVLLNRAAGKYRAAGYEPPWGEDHSGRLGRDGATPTIEEILQLRDRLASLGYKDYPHRVPAGAVGETSLTKELARRLSLRYQIDLKPNTIASRLSKYRADVANGERDSVKYSRSTSDRMWRAAVRDTETGEIYTGANHAEALDKAPDARWDALADDPAAHGFIGRDGAFLSREDAYAEMSRATESTPEALRAEIAREWGADMDALAAAGKAKIVANAAELPIAVPRDAAAVHSKGVAYFIADRIAPGEFIGKVLHEIAVHEAHLGLGPKGFAELNRQILRMAGDGRHPRVIEAMMRAKRSSAQKFDPAISRSERRARSDKIFADEIPAYVVEREALANLIENAPELPLVQRLLASLRQWLMRKFGTTFGMKLTVEDIRQMALTSLRRQGEMARRALNKGEVRRLGEREIDGAVLASLRDPGEFRAMFGRDPTERELDAMGFYSGLREAVKTGRIAKGAPSPGDAATGAQWLATLSKMPGVKKEELDWIGLPDWLKANEGQIAREEVLSFVRANGVQVKEVVLGGEIDPARSRDIQSRLLPLIEERERLTRWQEGHSRRVHSEEREQITEAEKQQYRDNARRLAEIRDQMVPIEQEQAQLTGGNRTRWTKFMQPGGTNPREFILYVEGIEPYATGDTSHYGDIGGGRAVVWFRTDERVDANGLRTFHVAEVQSKRHQDGRDRGYDTPERQTERKWVEDQANAELIPLRNLDQELYDKIVNLARSEPYAKYLARAMSSSDVSHPGRSDYYRAAMEMAGRTQIVNGRLPQDSPLNASLNALMTERYNNQSRINDLEGRVRAIRTPSVVPDAPFKNNAWASLAFKRIIRYAVENGFDQITWDRGQHQINRYRLSQHVSELRLIRNGDDEYVVATPRGKVNPAVDSEMWRPRKITADNSLEAIVGHGPARQLRDAAPKRRLSQTDDSHIARALATPMLADGWGRWGNVELRSLKTDGLEIGGEGMRAFYDRILPNIANDLGKKYGARVVETTIAVGAIKARNGWETAGGAVRGAKPAGTETVHSLPITPELREAAMGGMPLFSRARNGQNRGNVLGKLDEESASSSARSFRERLARVSESLGRFDAGTIRREAGGAGRGGRAIVASDGDAPIPALAAAAREALSVSGVRIKTIKSDFGALRIEVDPPIDLPPALRDALVDQSASRAHNVGIDFDLIEAGKNVADPNAAEGRRDGVYIRYSAVSDVLRGGGVGMWLYRQLIDWAHRRGHSIFSDGSISKEAWPTYARRLPEAGYEVVQINAASLDGNTHEAVAFGEPIWQVRQSYSESAYDAAPVPRGDYKIDAKESLRETIEAESARAEAYDALSPAEQIVADDPDAHYSRSLSAREAIEMSEAAQVRAAELRKGFDAAAKCAARHGMGQAGRESFITMGRGLAHAEAAGYGHVLGMGAAIPLGIIAGEPLSGMTERGRQERSRERAAAAGMSDPPLYDAPERGTPLSEVALDEPQAGDDFDMEDVGREGFAPPDAEDLPQ